MTLAYRTLRGSDVSNALDDLARLRIAVFRDWPYLYDGDLDYERRYMASYVDKPGAILVAAMDGSKVVGASTGTLMEDHAEDFQAAFAGSGYELADIFYCAESILLERYRGRGAGRVFFKEREAHARQLGRKHAVFCGVIRSDTHPLRPVAYRPLDTFWASIGYRKLDGVIASFRWKDVNEAHQTEKSLQFWIKDL